MTDTMTKKSMTRGISARFPRFCNARLALLAMLGPLGACSSAPDSDALVAGNGLQEPEEIGFSGDALEAACGLPTQQLVENGGFEHPNVGNGFGIFPSLPGWEVDSGPGPELQSSAVWGAAYDGNQKLELDSDDATTIHQNITTVAGCPYALSLAYSPHPANLENPIEVAWNGDVLAVLDADGTANQDAAWTTHAWLVIGSGGSSVLRLADLSPGEAIGGVGGWIDAVRLRPLDGGSWASKSPMTGVRFAPGAARLADKIYVVGGMSNWDVAVPTFEVFDPATNTSTIKGLMPNPRWGLAVTATKQALYAIGGYYGGGQYAATVNAYYPATNTWASLAPLPQAAVHPAAVALGGKVYAFGGNVVMDALYEYDPGSDVWTTKASMIHGRYGLAGAAANGKIYAIGGWNPSEGDLASVEEYDPTTDSWQEIAPLSVARTFLSAAVVDGAIYAIGGTPGDYHNNDAFSVVEKYRAGTGAWRTMTSMPTARLALATAAVNNQIYAFGGYYRTNHFLSLVEQYTPPPSGT